jgi:hypothetical protein
MLDNAAYSDAILFAAHSLLIVFFAAKEKLQEET